MDDIWFDEELTPTEQTVEQADSCEKGPGTTRKVDSVKGLSRPGAVAHTALGADWLNTQKLLTSGIPAVFYQVRLGFEVEVSQAAREAGAQFEYVQYSARMWSAASSRTATQRV